MPQEPSQNLQGFEKFKTTRQLGDVETAQIANSRADKFFEMALAELKIYVEHNSRIKLGAAKK